MGLHLPGEWRKVNAGEVFLKDFAARTVRVEGLVGPNRQGCLLEMSYRNLHSGMVTSDLLAKPSPLLTILGQSSPRFRNSVKVPMSRPAPSCDKVPIELLVTE
jgi:hypothetical protein